MSVLISHNRRLCLLEGIFLLFLAGFASAAERQILTGHVPERVRALTSIGPLAAGTNLHLAIGLPLRDAAGLTNLLQQIQDPASPNYRHFLTPEQFAERFGAAAQDYEAVVAFARAHGLTVTARHANRLVLSVCGATRDIERAFHVTLRVYHHPTEARTFHAPDTEPSLDLAVPILHVSGLDDLVLPHPQVRSMQANPAMKPEPLSGSGPYGCYVGADFRHAYVPGSTLDGAGQSVGLLQFDGYYARDISNYIANAHITTTATLSNVAVDGGVVSPGGGNIEVALDIEMVLSMAPGVSKIIVYEAPNPSPWDDLLSRMANDNLAQQLSCSWSGGPPDATAEQLFQQMAAQGQSFFNASGDSGAFAGPVQFPADSPNIVQVGGISLYMSGSGGAYSSETVWSYGGGGISTTYLIPSWQQRLDMTLNRGSTTMRNIPDVALTADNIYIWYNNGGQSGVGGTSCAAPLWAGFTALINQQAAINAVPPMGFLNPAFYLIGKGACFRDTTIGNNFNSSSPTLFPAVPGYDLCTGWGTPNGTNLINRLVPFNTLRITPVTMPAFSGAAGGPFSSTVTNLVLTNAGAVPLSWSAGSTSTWFAIQPASGTLAAGGATNVAVILTAAASNLMAQSYMGTVWITNNLDGSCQSRTFPFVVGADLFISPSGGATFAGPAGGAFNPTATSLFLTNAGAVSLTWSASSTSTWFAIRPASGTLSPGRTTNVVVELTAAASNLTAHSYTGTAWFTNSLDGTDQSRTYALVVGNAFLITPQVGASFMGAVGGPFRATSNNNLLLTNAGMSSLDWSANVTSTWFAIQPASGTLAAGCTTHVMIELTALASNLAAQVYTDTAWFTNSLDGDVQNGVVSLLVGQPLVQNGGFETGDLTRWVNSGFSQNNMVFSKDVIYRQWNPPINGVDVVHSGTYGLMLGAYGALGYVSQTLYTDPGRPYLLSFWVRNPFGGTPSEFLVQWDGTTLFDQINTGQFDWTNLQYVVQASGSNTLITFGARNDPWEFALDDISAQPLLLPAVGTIAAGTNAAGLSWGGSTNVHYQVEYTTNLVPAQWISLGAPIPGTDGVMMAVDSSPVASQRFYRVLLQP